jgi:hypothetical protein
MAQFPAQLKQESAKAYEAFCAYCAMGAGRSIEKVAQEYIKSVSLLRRWSVSYDWQDRIRIYDGDVAIDVAAEHTRRYLADLEDHRERYSKAGKILYHASTRLLQEFVNRTSGMEVGPATLSTISRALTIAADLEAHSLGIDQLLPRLDKEGGDDE